MTTTNEADAGQEGRGGGLEGPAGRTVLRERRRFVCASDDFCGIVRPRALGARGQCVACFCGRAAAVKQRRTAQLPRPQPMASCSVCSYMPPCRLSPGSVGVQRCIERAPCCGGGGASRTARAVVFIGGGRARKKIGSTTCERMNAINTHTHNILQRNTVCAGRNAHAGRKHTAAAPRI